MEQNSAENWILAECSGDWTHPIHIHVEEHQILSRDRAAPPLAVEHSRKDVSQLHPNERVKLFFRFRDLASGVIPDIAITWCMRTTP